MCIYINKTKPTMETYCVECKEVAAFSGKPQLFRTMNDRLVLKGVCVACNKMKCTFVSKKEGKGLLGEIVQATW